MSRSSKALAGRWLLTAVTIGIPLAVVPVAAASAVPPTLPPGFVTLTDDLGRISVSVPGTWTDIDTAPAADDAGGARPFIAAAPNIDSFVNTFDTPGVRYIAFGYAPDPQTLVTEYGLEAGCVSIAVQPYTDGTFTGVVQVGTECGSGLATWNMVVASPADLSFTAVVQVQTASPADQQALDVVLASFNVASGTAPSATPLPGPATVPVAPLPTGAAPLPTTPVTGAPLPTLAPAQVPVTAGVPGQTAPAGQTLTITDDTNRLTVQVPAAWAQTDTAPSANGNAFIVASPNLASYNSLDDALSLSVPALIFMGGSFMADTASAITFVSGLGDGCTPTEVTPYDDGVFVGHVQVFTNCGGTQTLKTIIVANPPSQSMTVTLIIQLQSIDDPALETILASFDVVG